MKSSLKLTGFLLLMIFGAVAATKKPEGEYKNLQVLPKDITKHKMDSIMESYNKALAIGCSFCHSPHPTIADSLDYASDANPMKNNARTMINLTMDINKKYFYYDTTTPPVYLNLVRCETCHRGDPYPVF